MNASTLPLNDITAWPLRMTRQEVAKVLRVSERELRRRVQVGRFPSADDGRTWSRDVIERYVKGGIKEFERQAERRERRGALSIAGGTR